MQELMDENVLLQAEVDTQRKSINEQTDGFQGALQKKTAEIEKLQAQVEQLKQDKVDALEDAQDAVEVSQ